MAVLKKVQQCGPPLLEASSFLVLFAIHDKESIPFTNAPSNGVSGVGQAMGRGSSKAARRAQIELSSSLCT